MKFTFNDDVLLSYLKEMPTVYVEGYGRHIQITEIHDRLIQRYSDNFELLCAHLSELEQKGKLKLIRYDVDLLVGVVLC